MLQSCLGGTPRSNIMIWGYASSKRLRTPGTVDADKWATLGHNKNHISLNKRQALKEEFGLSIWKNGVTFID